MMLSEHFSRREFEASDLAARRGIDNTLPDELLDNARATAAMLERIRTFLWRTVGHECPIIITSGYRAPRLNALLGSRATSDHLMARAADWVAPAAGTPAQIAALLLPHLDVLGIGQLALEYPRSPRAWLHTSTRRPQAEVNRTIAIHGPGDYEPLAEYLA